MLVARDVRTGAIVFEHTVRTPARLLTDPLQATAEDYADALKKHIALAKPR
jgi:hypothetical protein